MPIVLLVPDGLLEGRHDFELLQSGDAKALDKTSETIGCSPTLAVARRVEQLFRREEEQGGRKDEKKGGRRSREGGGSGEGGRNEEYLIAISL